MVGVELAGRCEPCVALGGTVSAVAAMGSGTASVVDAKEAGAGQEGSERAAAASLAHHNKKQRTRELPKTW